MKTTPFLTSLIKQRNFKAWCKTKCPLLESGSQPRSCHFQHCLKLFSFLTHTSCRLQEVDWDIGNLKALPTVTPFPQQGHTHSKRVILSNSATPYEITEVNYIQLLQKVFSLYVSLYTACILGDHIAWKPNPGSLQEQKALLPRRYLFSTNNTILEIHRKEKSKCLNIQRCFKQYMMSLTEET